MVYSPSKKKKKAPAAEKPKAGKEYRAFCVGVSLASSEFSFLQTGTKSGLSPLGKIAAHAWLDLGEQGKLRVDAIVFRAQEMEGLLFLPPSSEPDTKLGLAMRLLKARISQASAKNGVKLRAAGLWKKAYLSQPLPTQPDIARAKLRIQREARRIQMAGTV